MTPTHRVRIYGLPAYFYEDDETIQTYAVLTWLLKIVLWLHGLFYPEEPLPMTVIEEYGETHTIVKRRMANVVDGDVESVIEAFEEAGLKIVPCEQK